MLLVFLGTGSQYPSPSRGVSCIALRFDDGDIWLFDCGEGSQTQFQKSSLKPGKIRKIFITHLHGDHLFGLPGLLCSIGSWNQDAQEVIEIYGPVGLKKYLRTSLVHSYSYLTYRFVIHELQIVPEQICDEIKDWPVLADEDSNCIPNEQPGQLFLRDSFKNWELYENDKVKISANMIKHRVPCFGYVVEEKTTGKLDPTKLLSLGIKPGPLYQKLKDGEEITAPDGTVIKPSDCVGPAPRGRKLTILGDTCDSTQLLDIALDSDVLVHEATLENSLADKAIENGHSTPEMAVKFATSMRARTLILTHVSQRYAPKQGAKAELPDLQTSEAKSAEDLLEEAKSVIGADGCTILMAEDLFQFHVPRTRDP